MTEVSTAPVAVSREDIGDLSTVNNASTAVLAAMAAGQTTAELPQTALEAMARLLRAHTSAEVSAAMGKERVALQAAPTAPVTEACVVKGVGIDHKVRGVLDKYFKLADISKPGEIAWELKDDAVARAAVEEMDAVNRSVHKKTVLPIVGRSKRHK